MTRNFKTVLTALVLAVALLIFVGSNSSGSVAETAGTQDGVLSKQASSAEGPDWWLEKMENFKHTVGQQSFSHLEPDYTPIGGSYGLYEDEMRTVMGDEFVLTSSGTGLSDSEMLIFGFEGDLGLADLSGSPARKFVVDSKSKTAQDFQRHLQKTGEYPESLPELLSVVKPPSEWQDRSSDMINRALLHYYDWNAGEFVSIQPDPSEAEFGDRYMQKLNPEQHEKWLELTDGPEVEIPDGSGTLDLRNFEPWYWKLYGRDGEVLEAHIFHRGPIG